MSTSGFGRRVAVVAGVRTPFARAGTVLSGYSALELGRLAVADLMLRSGVDGEAVDMLVFGTVLPDVRAPNIAREVSLLPHFPRTVQAYTVGRACASANQAITDAADQILLGHANVVVAGGAESLSNVPILHSRGMSTVLLAISRARTLSEKLSILTRLRPRDFVPITPAIAEPSTGETMGQSADKMAKINGISREAQDQFALRSHLNAAKGKMDGRLAAEIVPIPVRDRSDTMQSIDNGIRKDSSIDALSLLKPAFDKKYGTVTAGNASPLTDGAAAVMLMSDDVARAHGISPLGYIRSYAYAAVDPGEQLLQAPVIAAPIALSRAGLLLDDMDLVEMHEAFAAQVLSNIRGFESQEWAARAGFSSPVGTVDPDRLNVLGGSIAIGHPFGATGARILTTLLNELSRRDGKFGLLTVCAAGGMGHAMVVERA